MASTNLANPEFQIITDFVVLRDVQSDLDDQDQTTTISTITTENLEKRGKHEHFIPGFSHRSPRS